MQINDKNFSIRINQEGVRKLIDALETDIMEAVWAADQPISVRGIYRVLRQHRDVRYPTVMTTTSKLVDKGFLSIVDCVGIHNLYGPNCTRAQLIEATVEHVMQVLFEEFPAQSIKCAATYGSHKP